jgi:hypothetical protein
MSMFLNIVCGLLFMLAICLIVVADHVGQQSPYGTVPRVAVTWAFLLAGLAVGILLLRGVALLLSLY